MAQNRVPSPTMGASIGIRNLDKTYWRVIEDKNYWNNIIIIRCEKDLTEIMGESQLERFNATIEIITFRFDCI